MKVALDSPVPLEEQLYRELRHSVASGEVSAGQELPSVRQLAGDLGIHWNTVARAYRRLGEEGLLAVRRGRGARVLRQAPSRRPPSASLREAVAQKLRDALTEAHLGGLLLEEVQALFREQVSSLPFRKART
jgi:DNA-binding transcriptional regulator YhcF (GntR family)